jgi:pimeloyl-ACP methyl ester carboxylesterase
MASKLLIVHGYSDGSTSFTALGDFLVKQGVYTDDDLFYLDYSSMDDEATFHDFADKLDADHRIRLNGQRVDVICHSTGSLVVRAWLALHAERNRRRKLDEDCPVDRLVCFAPANFGSDLAGLGQSFLGKFRTTFFNSHSHKGDFLESGKEVLRGLEPASPFQWLLSFNYDLHGDSSYFSEKRKESQRCYPYVFAAGEAYGGVEAKLVKQRAALGTDGTVRIAGTSLNTRACSLDFRTGGPALLWWQDSKFERIPFAVFAGFNHGSIVNPATPGYLEDDGPGNIAVAVLKGKRGDKSTTLDDYHEVARTFDEVSERNYARMPQERRSRYQQFFFRVRDDVDQLVEDYFIDFYVMGSDNKPHEALTLQFDEDFQSQITTHSTTKSHRVVMMNCSRLGEFHRSLKAEGAKLVLEVTGVSALPDVRYMKSTFVAYDPAAPSKGEPDLLFPNTTTLVDVILNRTQTDRLAVITGPTGAVIVSAVTAPEPPKEKTGRAALISANDAGTPGLADA